MLDLRTHERRVIDAAEHMVDAPKELTSSANLKHAVEELRRARRLEYNDHPLDDALDWELRNRSQS